MKLIEHIVEPEKLVILWQEVKSADGKGSGDRFVVGEISNAGTQSKLRYYDNEDTQAAKERGFKGLTAYPFDPEKIYNGNVETVLAKRLPPDSRGDYDAYLRAFRISPEAARQISPLALLAHTTGTLMGDGFSFFPVYAEDTPPESFAFEIAGFRHNGLKHYPDPRVLKDQPVMLDCEDGNEYDNQAVCVMAGEHSIGYIPKGLQTTVRGLMVKGYTLNATIERINGTKERPNILVFVSVGK